MQGPIVLEPELVADSKTDLAAFEFWETEPCHALLVETEVPTSGDIGLRLGLFQPLVVVSFNLYERPEYVLVLVSVFIVRDDGLGFVVHAGLLEIIEGGISVIAPQILEAVDLLEGYLTGSELLLLARRLDQPGQERTVVDEWRPQSRVPRDVFGNRSAWLAKVRRVSKLKPDLRQWIQ